MDISIIITYYSGLNILLCCLNELFKTLNVKNYSYEVIIVNDNPDIQLEKHLCEYPPIKIINHKINLGHPAACNNGAKAAKGDYLIFMDCDIFVTNNWLDLLLSTYKNMSNVGAVSPVIMDMNTNKVHMTGVAIHQVDMLKILRGSSLSDITQKFDNFDFLSSACIMIPKIIFESVNGFDERFFNSDGDLDLTYRIRTMGYQLITIYSAVVYHKGRVAGTMRNLAINDTKALFFKKWGNSLPDGLTMIQRLYENFINKNNVANSYLLINLCKTLVLNDYINIIKSSLNINIIQIYNFKQYNNSSGVSFIDFINNNLTNYNIPIIFLSDNFMCVSNNYFWFKTRKYEKDLSIDINGNIKFVKEITG